MIQTIYEWLFAVFSMRFNFSPCGLMIGPGVTLTNMGNPKVSTNKYKGRTQGLEHCPFGFHYSRWFHNTP